MDSRTTIRRTYATLSAGLAALTIGLAFGSAEGCVTSKVVDAAPLNSEEDVEADVDVEVASVAQTTAPSEPERPPPWAPPEQPLLPGVDGAAQLLARGQAQAALDQLASVGKLDTLPGEAALEPESREWFLAGAIAGRAYMQTQQWELAVLSLEPLAASKQFGELLPRDIVGYELARARTAWATKGDLNPAAADIQLRKAVSELGKLKAFKPDRMQAAMRVAQGEAMIAIAGDTPRATKTAAKQADKALERLITSFPNHADVGDWMLQRALAKQRAGLVKESAAALRRVAIDRAGEPEATRAWSELERLAAEHDKITAAPLTTEEQLAAGQAARVLRRIERSQQLLEAVWNDPEQPKHRHREAGHSLGWTYYKAREFSRCADVLTELYADVPSLTTRNDLARCLERAGRYDELIALWVGVYDGNKGALGSTALWNAIDLAVNAGKYAKANELLTEFETRFKGHGSERRWLHAWLPMRLGDDAQAIQAFTEMLDTGRTGGQERTITYFLGKLELRSDNKDLRAQGVARLRGLVEVAYERLQANGVIGGHPLYYGLMARQRLIDAGEDPGPPPQVSPLDWEQDAAPHWFGRADTLALLTQMAADHGESYSSLIRAEQLFAAGWAEEASREVRVAADEFINAQSVYSGSDMPGTRTEALVAGLAWAPEWRHPVASPSKAARKALRDADYRERLAQDFTRLTWAMQEPYRFGKLANYDENPYCARWHLRAYREPIERNAWDREIDPHHLWALMYTESRFRRHVVSYVGARGALQIMPWTGRQLVQDLGELEVGARFDPDILFSIEDNSRLATYYISELLKKFHGQAAMAYASYNGGPSNVARWLAAKSQAPRGVELDEFLEEIPFQESSRYARRVMEVHAAYRLMYAGELPSWTNLVDPEFELNIDY
ncbi:lytic transglycosylase domain-containing protein [Enhygromyxa salina]|uniref:Soluble lytic murein transglycosylase n=1 Tax=Enhygromyxa salina TaxID=215803 RepID=A0A2S9YV69_9BACT|nr:transglycosylase SLT domain-containing protein [Enhygromyxa salina]PRQ08939.1 Soluble lytic murein transglycosylase precursor [Enhygromyxa salina]